MSAHTQGPWHVRTFDGSSWSVDAAGDLMIAQAQQLRPLSIDPKQLERHANARLIAAAPEQHAALLPIAMFPLEDFAQYDDCADMRVIFKANDWSLTVGDIRRARAAIAKATGATP